MHIPIPTHHFQLVHDVQLTDLTEVLVKDLHKAVDELKDAQLILDVEHQKGKVIGQASKHLELGWAPDKLTCWQGAANGCDTRMVAGRCAALLPCALHTSSSSMPTMKNKEAYRR